MSKNAFEAIEQQEIIKILIDKGFGELVDALLMNEGECFTKKGRPNKSGICRILGWKTKELEDTMEECRIALGESFV